MPSSESIHISQFNLWYFTPGLFGFASFGGDMKDRRPSDMMSEKGEQGGEEADIMRNRKRVRENIMSRYVLIRAGRG